jgi:hypothetical protein
LIGWEHNQSHYVTRSTHKTAVHEVQAHQLLVFKEQEVGDAQNRTQKVVQVGRAMTVHKEAKK